MMGRRGDGAETLVLDLAQGPTAGSEARRGLLTGNGTLPGSVRDDVLLLVTELVTNAVCHSSAGPGARVRVEVFGEGAGFAAEGPGRVLVDRIADHWAITRTASGTCAWFEIAYGL